MSVSRCGYCTYAAGDNCVSCVQAERDDLRVQVRCFGAGWSDDTGSSPAWRAAAESAALAALCVHWLRSAPGTGDSLLVTRLARCALAYAHGAGLAVSHTLVVQARRHLFNSLKATKDVRSALAAGQQLLESVDAAQLPDCWPPTAALVATLATLAMHAEDVRASLQLATRAEALLSVTHAGTALHATAQAQVQQCMAVMST